MNQKQHVFNFSTFLDFPNIFFEPRTKRPQEPFSDFFGISGVKGLNDSCKGPRRLRIFCVHDEANPAREEGDE